MDRPAVLGITHRLVLRRQVSDDVHSSRVEPQKERLVVRLGLVDEGERLVANLVVDRFHPLRIERAGVLDLLLADLAPARHFGRVILVGRPTVNHVARPDLVEQFLRVIWMRRIFHRIEMVEVAEELVEAVHRRQKFVLVAEMVLAELAGGVAHALQRVGNGYRLGRNANGGTRLADRRHSGPDRKFAGDEVGASRGAARLCVIICKDRAFGRDLVEVWCAPRHQAAMVCANVPHPDVVAHDHDDIRRLGRRLGARRHERQQPRSEERRCRQNQFLQSHSIFSLPCGFR